MPLDPTLLGAALALAHALGVAAAVDAIMTGRTPQGSLAWALALAALPYIAVPLYLVFGRRRYRGYIDARREGYGPITELAEELRSDAGAVIAELPERHADLEVLEQLVSMPFTRGNHAQLLEDGDATFRAIFEALAEAERYVLVQFFIVRDDQIGREFEAALLACRARGVEVAFLYDEIGSRKLSRRFKSSLRASGVRITPFRTTRGPENRLQLNFRNHRKLVLVDGRVALLGGINVGDEYLGRGPLGAWRDTFVRIEGPAVQGVQLAFLEDWHWATDELPAWDWTPRRAAAGDQLALILPTGPADSLETASLMFVTLFQSARERLWISTPYFVCDSQVMGALELAALRGVDVRILVPARSDYRVVRLAGWTYFDELTRLGVRIHEYDAGFLHQKLVLVDDEVVLVGTKNLDNRSLRLNFEVSALIVDAEFAAGVEARLAADLAVSAELPEGALADRPLWFRVAARTARLFAPVL